MIVYTYTGLLLNYKYYFQNDGLPRIAVVVGSVVAFFNIYPNYSRLHRIILKKAIKLQKSSSPTLRPASEQVADHINIHQYDTTEIKQSVHYEKELNSGTLMQTIPRSEKPSDGAISSAIIQDEILSSESHVNPESTTNVAPS